MSNRSRNATAVAIIIAGALGALVTTGQAAPQAAQRAGDAPEMQVSPGYRNASRGERRKMNKVKLDLTRRYGWFIGRKDPSIGFVCGYLDGSPWGWGLRRKGKGWRAYTEASSGALQNYAHMCGAYSR